MLIRRMPKPALRPFVRMLWASDGKDLATTPHRERVVPTGTMHLAFRLSDHPLRLFEDAAATLARIVGHVVVGGARSSFYVREVFGGERSVGVQLHPGAAAVLFGVPCDELAERHTPLEQVWSPTALRMRDRLGATGNLEEQLDVLESMLAARLPRVPFVAPERVISQTTVAALQSGLVYGFAGQVDAIVGRITDELGVRDVPVVATGGLADLIAPHSASITAVDQELTLHGLRIVWERNRS